MRQTGTHDDERRALLADLVDRTADRRELVAGDVLHLVDEDADTDAEVAREVGDVGEQLDHVELEVAGVGAALHRGHVDGRLPAHPLAVGERGAQRERLEHAGHRVDPLGVAVPVGHLAHRGVHRLRQGQPQRLLRPGLDLAGAPGALHGLAAQRVEQHGLADTAKTGEHHRALRARRRPAPASRRTATARGHGPRARAGAGRRRGRRGCVPGPRCECIRASSGFLRFPSES